MLNRCFVRIIDYRHFAHSMSDSRDTDEETAPPEPETGEGKFVFPNGAVYGEMAMVRRKMARGICSASPSHVCFKSNARVVIADVTLIMYSPDADDVVYSIDVHFQNFSS